MLIEQIASLGAIGWILCISSCLGLAIVLERLVTYAILPSLKKKNLTVLFQELRACNCNASNKNKLCSSLYKNKGIRQGIAILLSHNACNKEMREEVAGLWLLKQKRALHAWLKPLMLIGILAPMFGLLGTILGLINMFQGIAATAGPVTPDILAAGLWEAMYTTAFGLIVAIPALAGAHGLGVWANHYMGQLEFSMNHANLLLEGIDMDDNGLAFSERKTTQVKKSVMNSRKNAEAVLA